MTLAPPDLPKVLDYACPEKPAPSITHTTAAGALLSFGQTGIIKVLGIVTQIVLARLLKPEDFGLAGLALMAATFAGMLRDAGFSQVLMRRHRDFDRWANAAFWMSNAGGLVAGVLLVISAPLLTVMFHAPGLGRLILILAVASPVISLSTVSAARLQVDLRFRFLTLVGIATAVFSFVLTIALALGHMGAASLVIPIIAVAALRAALLWRVGRFRLLGDPQFRRWRYLAGDTGWLLLGGVFMCFLGQGDYLVLGFRQTPHVVGVYFFAFSLATQVSVLTSSVSQVIQPALCHLQQKPVQQVNAFVRAATALAALISPICLLQVALAGPFVRVVFGAKWIEAIPVIQMLSAGWAVWGIGCLGLSLLQAQGRFRTGAILQGAYAAVFLAAVAIGAPFAAVGVAAAVALVLAAMGFVSLYLAVRSGQGTWAHVARITVGPQLLATAAVAVGCGITWFVPLSRFGDIIRLVLVTTITAVVYLPLLRRLMPDTWTEGMSLFKTFRDRVIR